MGNETRINSPIFFFERNRNDIEYPKIIGETDSNLMQHLNAIEFEKISQDEHDTMRFLPFYAKLFLTFLMWISLIIGSFCKCVMYAYVLVANKKNRGWMHRPINVLTISSAICHHITHIWMVIWYTVINLDLSGLPLADAIGDYWCSIIEWISLYGIFSMTVSSLGIAIYRILYLTNKDLVKYVIGERLLLLIIWSASITVPGVLAFLSQLEDDGNRFHMNMCRGITVIQARIVLDYRLSLGEKLITSNTLQIHILAISIAFQVTELIIYIRFFVIRYNNDNGNIRKILTEDVIRSRNAKNITNFLAQFYGFLTEYAFLLGLLVIHFFGGDRKSEMKVHAATAKIMDYGLLSAVEIFSSPSLRAFLRRKIMKIE